jgi:hypothetical protein
VTRLETVGGAAVGLGLSLSYTCKRGVDRKEREREARHKAPPASLSVGCRADGDVVAVTYPDGRVAVWKHNAE